MSSPLGVRRRTLRRPARRPAAAPGERRSTSPSSRRTRRDRGVVDLLAAGGGHELGAGLAERALARDERSSCRTRPAIRARRGGRGRPRRRSARGRRGCRATGRSGSPGAIRHAAPSSASRIGSGARAVGRGLLEHAHRRVQRRGAPEEVVQRSSRGRRSAGVVVRALEERAGCRRSRSRAGRRCCRRAGRRPARACPRRPRGGSPRRAAGRRRAGRRSRLPSPSQRDVGRGGCSARSGRPTRAGRGRSSGSARRSAPPRSRRGFRRRTSTSRPAISTGYTAR